MVRALLSMSQIFTVPSLAPLATRFVPAGSQAMPFTAPLCGRVCNRCPPGISQARAVLLALPAASFVLSGDQARQSAGPDRKSTRLNSSHLGISYAVFCLKKKIQYVTFEEDEQDAALDAR